MKRRIRNKIIKRFERQHQLNPGHFPGWGIRTGWRRLWNKLEREMDAAYDHHASKYCK